MTFTFAVVALLAWGVLVFGAVYPWAYWPLLAGVHRDRAHPDAARPGNRAVAQPGLIFQAEDVA